jgi:hypothetical protein
MSSLGTRNSSHIREYSIAAGLLSIQILPINAKNVINNVCNAFEIYINLDSNSLLDEMRKQVGHDHEGPAK